MDVSSQEKTRNFLHHDSRRQELVQNKSAASSSRVGTLIYKKYISRGQTLNRHNSPLIDSAFVRLQQEFFNASI